MYTTTPQIAILSLLSYCQDKHDIMAMTSSKTLNEKSVIQCFIFKMTKSYPKLVY